MKCLKCMKEDNTKEQQLDIPEALAHLNYWHVCDECVELDEEVKAEKAHDYYESNKQNYRELHKKYKSDLSDSYVANCIADGTALTGKDIPQPLVKAKRQYMKVNRRLKEIENG